MKDLENKKILGVPLGTTVVILGIGVAVYIITTMWGGKLIAWIQELIYKPKNPKAGSGSGGANA